MVITAKHNLTKVSHSPWLAFRRPNVRDLAYAIACPPVLLTWAMPNPNEAIELTSTAFWQRQFWRFLPRLHELDHNPKPLNRFLAQHLLSHRLGFRFETLIHFWLTQTDYHDYELLAHNVQLFVGKQTCGELDFLVKNKAADTIEHWELAIKFYLGKPPFDPPHWVGLNQKDTLANKIAHLQQKQFNLTELDGYHIDKRIAIIKGRFFLPQHLLANVHQFQPPCWLNSALPLGIWQNQLPDNLNPTHWRRAYRVEWFTKRDFYDQFELNQHPKQQTSLLHQFSGRRHPIVWQSGLYFHITHVDKPAMREIKTTSGTAIPTLNTQLLMLQLT